MYTNSIGVIYNLKKLLDKGIDELLDLGISSIQLSCWDTGLMTEENAAKVCRMLAGKLKVTSFWAGWGGPKVWDAVDGPVTLGIVPVAYRWSRVQDLIKGADFASWLRVPDMATHAGFIPEHPSFPEYRGVLQAVKFIASYCKQKGLFFNFETGQETPVTLMRLITDTGMANVGINLDPANLILYGRGNPVDALDIFKGRIRGVHIKDGDYATDFYKLGQGYGGDLYIEREISGDQQIIDIKKTVNYLKQLMKA